MVMTKEHSTSNASNKWWRIVTNITTYPNQSYWNNIHSFNPNIQFVSTDECTNPRYPKRDAFPWRNVAIQSANEWIPSASFSVLLLNLILNLIFDFWIWDSFQKSNFITTYHTITTSTLDSFALLACTNTRNINRLTISSQFLPVMDAIFGNPPPG